MSSRRASKPELSLDNEPKVGIPILEQTVQKKVPAVIHWGTVAGVDRDDDEVIGTAVIYEDGTSDILINADISDDAKRLTSIINQELGNYSMGN